VKKLPPCDGPKGAAAAVFGKGDEEDGNKKQ
jgi:hypothetical protein